MLDKQESFELSEADKFNVVRHHHGGTVKIVHNGADPDMAQDDNGQKIDSRNAINRYMSTPEKVWKQETESGQLVLHSNVDNKLKHPQVFRRQSALDQDHPPVDFEAAPKSSKSWWKCCCCCKKQESV